MSWGTPDDIKNMLDYGNKDYDMSYLNYEVVIKFDGIDESVRSNNKYLKNRIILNSDGSYQVKFIGVARYSQLIVKISKFLTVYNSYIDVNKLSLKNISGYKSECIFKFLNQDKDLKICDAIRRLTSLNIKYDTSVHDGYMEILVLNNTCRISFFKEPSDESRTIFVFIESQNVMDYQYKLHTMANIMGVLMNNQNMFSDNEFTTLLVL